MAEAYIDSFAVCTRGKKPIMVFTTKNGDPCGVCDYLSKSNFYIAMISKANDDDGTIASTETDPLNMSIRLPHETIAATVVLSSRRHERLQYVLMDCEHF